jgi:hypothetical protein
VSPRCNTDAKKSPAIKIPEAFLPEFGYLYVSSQRVDSCKFSLAQAEQGGADEANSTKHPVRLVCAPVVRLHGTLNQDDPVFGLIAF